MKVYRHYLKGNCTIDRFYQAFILDFNNLAQIQSSIFKLHRGGNSRNGLIDQYLIYLEKQKEYEKCIEIILFVKGTGWTNDFEKRLKRCIAKIEKNL
jgi:hypothetical protein